MCVRYAYTLLPLQAWIHPLLPVLQGHVQAPGQAVGPTQPTSTSCPYMPAAAELCIGCFPAKLPGETVDGQSTLTVAAVDLTFLDLERQSMVKACSPLLL